MTNNDVVFYFSFSCDSNHRDPFDRLLAEFDQGRQVGFPAKTIAAVSGGTNLPPAFAKTHPSNFIMQINKANFSEGPAFDREFTYGFIIYDAADKLDIDEIYDEFTEQIESEYGVHDWCSAPDPKNPIAAIGYTTYEVAYHEISQVMCRWKADLQQKLGENVRIGPVVKVPEPGTDYEIYQYIREKTKDV